MVASGAFGQPMDELDKCRSCGLDIEMRYGVSTPRSRSQGYWSHLEDVTGIEADKDHDALR